MQYVSAEITSRTYDSRSASVATVPSGETFTVDAVSVIRGDDLTLPKTYDDLKIPVTGPVEVHGVSAGDWVRIDIIDIDIADVGAMVTLPGHGVFGDRVTTSGQVVPIIKGIAILDDDVHVPVAPMVGKLALAPSDFTPPSSTVGDYGGNMDNRRLGIGSTLYLRASVRGGQLYIGDLHACQGDGESSLTGVEVSGTVTLRVTKVPSLPVQMPVAVAGDDIMTIGSGSTFEEAAKQAADGMLELLVDHQEWSTEKAAMALSLIGNVEVCQLVNPRVSARMVVNRRYLPNF